MKLVFGDKAIIEQVRRDEAWRGFSAELTELLKKYEQIEPKQIGGLIAYVLDDFYMDRTETVQLMEQLQREINKTLRQYHEEA